MNNKKDIRVHPEKEFRVNERAELASGPEDEERVEHAPKPEEERSEKTNERAE
jgi:hypothetical protein